MLQGIDIARYQKGLSSEYILSQDFVIMKATEGVRYKDPMLDEFYDLIHGSDDGKPDANKLYGFYHFARPAINDPIPEARNFVKRVGHHAGEAMFCLDWEGIALKEDLTWAYEWLEYVRVETGVRPLIYCPGWYTYQLNLVQRNNYGLWVAHWGVKEPQIGIYPFWAMWQYNVDGKLNVDKDYFNGDAEQFKKYCRRE